MIQDNTAKWKIRKFTNFEVAKSALPVGHLYFSLEKIVPVGSIPAFGGLYSRALYADLFAYAQEKGLVISENEWQSIANANDGNCAYYSSGDGSTTFRVPKIPNTIVGDVPSEVPVVGNGMALGLTNGNTNGGLAYYEGHYPMIAVDSVYGKAVNNSLNVGTVTNGALGVTTEASKSGIVAKMSSTKTTGQWLIVAFGTISNIGNADVANVMQAVEQVQTSVGALEQGVGTAIDYIVESYRNGTSWYEVYKSGKVRQGGAMSFDLSGTNKTFVISLNIPFANTDYFANPVPLGGSTGTSTYQFAMRTVSKTVSNFEVSVYNDAALTCSWYAEGQGA